MASTAAAAAACTGSLDGPLPTREQVLSCQFSSWYPHFRSLPKPSNALKRTKATVQAVILDLPDNFRDFLLADGVQLPAGCKTSSLLYHQSPSEWSSDDDDDDDDDDDEDEKKNDTNAQANPPSFAFPELDRQIARAIEELGGSAAPKLNWSSPKDAVWMNGGSMQCKTPGDVYLLLKSSDFCAYDLQHALTDISHDKDVQDDDPFTDNASSVTSTVTTAPPLQLCLRKWCHLYPSQEFRCFVKSQQLVAISQRHYSQHFAHLVRDQFLHRSLILEFWEEIIVAQQQSFNNNFALSKNYVMDVYVDKKEKVWLLDFNVWGRRTDALLFEWSELEAIIDVDDALLPEIRVVETEKQVREDPLASYRAPIDTLHVAASIYGGGANKDDKFEDFMRMCERPSVLEAEEDNDDDDVDED